MVHAFALGLLCGYYLVQKSLAGTAKSGDHRSRFSQTGYLVRVLSRLIPLPHVSYVIFVHPSLILSTVGSSLADI